MTTVGFEGGGKEGIVKFRTVEEVAKLFCGIILMLLLWWWLLMWVVDNGTAAVGTLGML